MEDSIKNVFIKQIKFAVKDNEFIKYDILNTIKDNNEMSEIVNKVNKGLK